MVHSQEVKPYLPKARRVTAHLTELEILVAGHPVAHRASGWSWWIQNLHTQMALLQHQLAGTSIEGGSYVKKARWRATLRNSGQRSLIQEGN